MSKKAQRIRQKEGEGIRSFAIRASTELQKIWGKTPSKEEWKEAVMMGAHEATVLEMDRVESSRGESDLWKLITAAEYWEQENEALLSLPDSEETKELLGPADRPKPHAVDAQTLAADVECGWCSKIGHAESSCRRQNPLCGEYGGEHPSRKHLGVVRSERK